MFRSEQRLCSLECSVHLPFSPEFVSPMTKSWAEKVCVSQNHYFCVIIWIGIWIVTWPENEIVNKKFVVEKSRQHQNQYSENFAFYNLQLHVTDSSQQHFQFNCQCHWLRLILTNLCLTWLWLILAQKLLVHGLLQILSTLLISSILITSLTSL